MRVTQSGSYGEAPGTAFKGFDGGWRRAWNANSTRFFIIPWTLGNPKNTVYWMGFSPSKMAIAGIAVPAPPQFTDLQWDQYDPDVMVGLSKGIATSYNVIKNSWTPVFDPSQTNWGGSPWLSVWGGNSVCIASSGQDIGYRLVCHDRQKATSDVINLRTQTINGSPLTVYFEGRPVTLPSSVTVHAVTLGQDGRWLAIDTHGNSMCSVPYLPRYASTSLFIDLQTKVGYEWSVGCGGTHWAYGHNGVMMQSSSPRWTATGADGPCNSDSRGIAHRNTDITADSSLYQTGPCAFYRPSTWNISVHLSWLNNAAGANANRYPVLMATTDEGVPNMFMSGDIAAMETSAPPYQGRYWRFAQTWNDRTSTQCGFLAYSSPSVSPDGKWAVFPSDWRGQTGSNGVCTNKRRTDLFIFELK
jgi:hypothetical protein